MPRKKYLVFGRSRGTGPRATVRGDFFLCSDDREGQALALRCAGDFFVLGQSRGTGPRATVRGKFSGRAGFSIKKFKKI